MIRVAINGFGRIGRTAFKQALERSDEMEVVAVNDLTTKENLAYLLRYDSVYGPYDKKVEVLEEEGKNFIEVDGKRYQLFNEKDPASLPWGDLDVDVVVESTGVFATKEKASAHLDAGAKRVVISAPTKDEDTPHHLPGSSEDVFSSGDLPKITSNASCTTNAVVPVSTILKEKIGFSKSMMTTVHGYTASQAIVDSPNPKDNLRGRAGAVNIVPSHTGAANASVKVNSDLTDFEAIALRVPVISGSIVDLVFLADKDVTAEEVNDVLKEAAKEDRWQGVFTVSEEPLVSTDILGNPHASIADLSYTRVAAGNLVKVMAWYDNEWGYTSALMEHVVRVGNLEK